MADNSITVSGNLTRDFELRYTAGGKAVASAGIAVSRRYQQNGEWQEQTTFLNVTAWDKLAENCAQSCPKGTRVIVSGRLEVREYEGRDGEKRTSTDIVADDIGPSMKWATAVIERTVREKPSDENSSRSWQGGQRGSASGSGGGARRPDPVYGDDEEPF